jgi:Fe-S-cluster containining protein
MIPSRFLQTYESLTSEADKAFQSMHKEHTSAMQCERHCSDCCHAVFGLFLLEAVYLKHYFDQLDSGEKEDVLQRGEQARKAQQNLEQKLYASRHNPEKQTYILAMERIRCPLLNDDQDCVLYPHRPVTCRAYGIPTRIHGKWRVCGKTGFSQQETKTAVFDLDGVYRNLHGLSKELLKSLGGKDPDKASLLISVSKALSISTKELMREIYA